MAELRWLLLLFGIAVIAVVYFFTRYKPQIEEKLRRVDLRREPRLDLSSFTGTAEQAAENEPDSVISAEDTVQDPVPVDPKMVVAIRLMANDTQGFLAEQLILRMREMGLRHGQFGIFHRYPDPDVDAGPAIFSVASLVEPGSFDLTRIRIDRYPGISVFMMLPGPQSGIVSFDEMMDFSRKLAKYLDGHLLDEQGGTLSIQRERYIREEVIQFEHRGAE